MNVNGNNILFHELGLVIVSITLLFLSHLDILSFPTTVNSASLSCLTFNKSSKYSADLFLDHPFTIHYHLSSYIIYCLHTSFSTISLSFHFFPEHPIFRIKVFVSKFAYIFSSNLSSACLFASLTLRFSSVVFSLYLFPNHRHSYSVKTLKLHFLLSCILLQ